MAQAGLEALVVRPLIRVRQQSPAAAAQLIQDGVHPLLARLWAARGLTRLHPGDWSSLIAPSHLNQVDRAATALADAIEAGRKLMIVADYDCDGATACAVAVRGLRDMGAKVEFLVPDRFTMGYGLSPAVVELAGRHPAGKPDLLITVDNGVASIDGVQAAHEAGMAVIVTDHHLPGAQLPPALAIVNPNLADSDFPSRHLAGVGVIFYVLLALRAVLRSRGAYVGRREPALSRYADLVALGTVADVVRLDRNNRLLVAQGLKAIRRGMLQPGLAALFAVAGRDPAVASVDDLGFAIGPRINAAGRMADMAMGINCLIEEDPQRALQLARALDTINQERRRTEAAMQQEALDHLDGHVREDAASVCVWQPNWHPGVIGLVASRLKETYWRPALAFAPQEDGILRGSGRSVPDVHLRDALDLVSRRMPDSILQFGGHAMAAGLTLRQAAFDQFSSCFDESVRTLSGRDRFEPVIDTDGSLDLCYLTQDVTQLLSEQVWGAGFPLPTFLDLFQIVDQRLLKGQHLKLLLERSGSRFDAIWFNHPRLLGATAELAYRPTLNRWQGQVRLQLMIIHEGPTTTLDT